MKDNHLLIFLLGLVSIVGQTVLLRELMIEVYGNEIVFAFYLSIWLFAIALGAYLGRYLKYSTNMIIFFFVLLLIILPLEFHCIRSIADMFTIVKGEVLNIPAVFLLGFIILLPGCMISGILFPLISKNSDEGQIIVRRAYIIECFGIIAGSFIFFLLVNKISQIRLLYSISLIGIFIILLKKKKLLLIIPAIILILLLFCADDIYLASYKSRYNGQNLIISKDSRYGRLDVTDTQDQKNYFWNGELFASEDNVLYAQQMAGFVLLQHPRPKKILMAGGLLNGLTAELLEDSRINIDYLELDKNIIELAEEEHGINLINSDAIHYINNCDEQYDLIFFDLPDPSSLFLNRFYTWEFFKNSKKILTDDKSVMIITLSSGTNFMTKEIRELNKIEYWTMKEVFKNVEVIAAEKNIYIGSDGRYISGQEEILSQRLKQNKNYFNQTVIFEKCNLLKRKEILQIIDQKSRINTFSTPRAYLSTLLLWTDIRAISLTNYVNLLKENLLLFAVVITLLCTMIILFINKKKTNKLIMYYGIFVASMVNFVLELILINHFQMQHGYIYLMIFVFSASFMLGLTAGFGLHNKIKIKLSYVWLINLLLIMIIWLGTKLYYSIFILILLNFLSAIIEGYILSSLLYHIRSNQKASSFYFIDSLGAMTGGLIFSTILIPTGGFGSSLLILAIITLSMTIINFKFSY